MTSKLFSQELIDAVKGDIFFALLHHTDISPYGPSRTQIAPIIEEDYRKLLDSLSWRCDRANKTRWWKALVDLLAKIPEHAQSAIREIDSRLAPDIERREVRATNLKGRWRRALYNDIAEDGNLEKWMRACDDMADDLEDEERSLLYQCFMQKLLGIVLVAFQRNSEEMMGWVYKF